MGWENISERLFGGKTTDSAVVESSPGVGAAPGAPDLKALRQSVGKTRRGNAAKVEAAQLDAGQQQLLDELFENENWEEMAGLYFETRFALTGFEHFRLDDRQRRILGRSMGTCMKLLLKIDPQWVALIVFSTNMGMFAAEKEMTYRQFLRQQRIQRAQREGQPAKTI